jgi:RNA polymerase-interacting CarD/CdnL/TRCF family regulator
MGARFKPGDRVKHPFWGIGTVARVYGETVAWDGDKGASFLHLALQLEPLAKEESN